MKRRLAFLTAMLASLGTFAEVSLAASSPSVVTGKASKVKQTSAVLNATVYPNGSSTVYAFQWGLAAPGYGLVSHAHSAGSGTTAVSVKTTAGGLIPGTTYHYRIVAFSKSGTSAGADRTFKTGGSPPADATTGPAIQVGKTFVTLTAVVNPHGAVTSYTFQYGTTTGYGSLTAGGSLSASKTPQTVTAPIQGLAPGTIFHYRLLATHSGFPPTAGADQIFMTEPAHSPTPRLQASITPHRARHRPFTFTTTGSVAGPRFIPAQFACSGEVKVRFLHRLRTVALTIAAVQPNCTFSAQTVLTRKPGRGSKHRRVSLTVLTRFLGNGYLARARAGAKFVVVG